MKDKFLIPSEYQLSRRDFDLLVEDQIKWIKKTLASKGDEYSPGQDDALHNFNVGMIMTQASGKMKTREEVIWGMAMKHHISIMDMVLFDVEIRPQTITVEKINEKFGDMINYLILMKASMLQTIELVDEALPFPKSTKTSIPHLDVQVIDPNGNTTVVRLVNHSSGPVIHFPERGKPVAIETLPSDTVIYPQSRGVPPTWYVELTVKYPDNIKTF